MDQVVFQPEADQNRIEAQDLLDISDHRDRSSRSDQHGRRAVDVGKTGHGPLEMGAVDRDLDGGRTAESLDLPPRIRRRAGIQELLDPGQDLLRVLPRHQPATEFDRSLRRDHRLGAGPGVAAPDAVYVAGRPRPDAFEGRPVRLAARSLEADAHQETGLVETKAPPLLAFG